LKRRAVKESGEDGFATCLNKREKKGSDIVGMTGDVLVTSHASY
jgi:hypothetical protein